jgi:hypothetical protein
MGQAVWLRSHVGLHTRRPASPPLHPPPPLLTPTFLHTLAGTPAMTVNTTIPWPGAVGSHADCYTSPCVTSVFLVVAMAMLLAATLRRRSIVLAIANTHRAHVRRGIAVGVARSNLSTPRHQGTNRTHPVLKTALPPTPHTRPHTNTNRGQFKRPRRMETVEYSSPGGPSGVKLESSGCAISCPRTVGAGETADLQPTRKRTSMPAEKDSPRDMLKM